MRSFIIKSAQQPTMEAVKVASEFSTPALTTTDAGQQDDYIFIERVIEAVILSVIFVVAVVGNSMLWMVVLRRKSLRTCSNALILCLSTADLLVSIVNMPVTIFTILKGEWIFSEFACVFFGFLNMTTFIASVMSLGAISINRYILIVHASRFRNVYTKRNTGFFIAGVWTLSVLLASPPLLGWANYGYLEGQSFCFCEWTNSISYTFFMVGVCFGGPCSVMSFCYYKILRAFKESQRNTAHSGGTTKEPPRRLSMGSAKDNCMLKIRNSLNKRLEQNNRRRQSLPAEVTDVERNLTENGELGSPGSGVENGCRRLATTGMVRKARPVTSFQAFSSENSLSNVNAAIIINSPTSVESLKSTNIPRKGYDTPPSSAESANAVDEKPPPPVVTKSKRWSSPFKRSKKNTLQVPKPVVQQESLSTDDFSNPFINSVSVMDITAQTVPGNTGPTGQRKVPPGLYGTPNGPSASRIARKKKRREEEMRLTKSFLVVIFVFILCWFPFCITMFWSVFIRDQNKSVPRPIDMATLLLGFANSCCNPIIYGVMNRKFRSGFKSLLCFWADPNIVNPWKPPRDSSVP